MELYTELTERGGRTVFHRDTPTKAKSTFVEFDNTAIAEEAYHIFTRGLAVQGVHTLFDIDLPGYIVGTVDQLTALQEG